MEWSEKECGSLLTFVVPAISGCNLKCPYCIISQRQEITANILTSECYAHFISQTAEVQKIGAVAIQGYEPLLPGSMPYTRAILSEARSYGIPAGLVTNGVYLREATAELAALKPDKIGVSLDSADPERHDRLRGVAGAWRQTVAGIEHALGEFGSSGPQISVISVLMPGHVDYLQEMPKRLREWGVRDWIVNPLMRIEPIVPNIVAGSMSGLINSLKDLSSLAAEEGIRLTIDDELGLLFKNAKAEEQAILADLNIRTLPRNAKISRLVPSGHCSAGLDIARRLSSISPKWDPKRENAAEFLSALHLSSPDLQLAA